MQEKVEVGVEVYVQQVFFDGFREALDYSWNRMSELGLEFGVSRSTHLAQVYTEPMPTETMPLHLVSIERRDYARTVSSHSAQFGASPSTFNYSIPLYTETMLLYRPKLCPFEFKSQVRPISFIIMPRLCSYWNQTNRRLDVELTLTCNLIRSLVENCRHVTLKERRAASPSQSETATISSRSSINRDRAQLKYIFKLLMTIKVLLGFTVSRPFRLRPTFLCSGIAVSLLAHSSFNSSLPQNEVNLHFDLNSLRSADSIRAAPGRLRVTSRREVLRVERRVCVYHGLARAVSKESGERGRAGVGETRAFLQRVGAVKEF
ncbi:hypothetical protein R3P38DRAFT_2762319 [Favolaschia claudopus]|uniref:Uncharacterized protein n=1 Tax=Favolaschia claudopus TaxID=2862362 RepID=A0AAW0DJV5_9AGAR